jgi:nucleoside transporter
MMFLQYSVWGIWLPVLAGYLSAKEAAGGLGFTGQQVGLVLGLAVSLGAISAPFIAGQVADRYLNAERALAILLLVGGALIFVLGGTRQFMPFLLISVAYSICYMPTLSLTNSLCFSNLRDPEKQFPPIRLWGTIGWIVASNAFGWFWLNLADPVANTARIADSLRFAGIIAAGYAVFCLFVLPKTPPKRSVEHPLAFLTAFQLMKVPAFLTLTLIALPVSMIHQAFFLRMFPFLTGPVGFSQQVAPGIMSIGQFSEIVFLALLGLLIKKLGYRGVLTLGALAYSARFLAFAFAPSPAVVATMQAFHGLCYGCFFAGSFLFVEKIAPKDIRHSAQTVFGIIILGIGPILAAFYNGLFDASIGNGSYSTFWLSQSVIAGTSALLLLAVFREPRSAGQE